jgi:hypothetical protein
VKFVESAALKKQRDLHAAGSMMAYQYGLGVGVQAGALVGNAIHRHRERVLDAANLDFPRFSHVNQNRRCLRFVIEPRAQLLRLNWRDGHDQN